MHLRNMSALSDFFNIFDRQCRSFFAEPLTFTYTTDRPYCSKVSTLAQGLSAPHHHSLAPSSITISSIPQTTEQLREGAEDVECRAVSHISLTT